MKFTKQRIKQIIKEEIGNLEGNFDPREMATGIEQLKALTNTLLNQAASLEQSAQDHLDKERFASVAGALDSIEKILSSIG